MEHTTENFEWSKIKMASQDEDRYFFYLTDLHAIIIKKSPNNMDENETIKYNALINKSLYNVGLDD